MEPLHEPRFKLIAEAARELRKGERWSRMLPSIAPSSIWS
jgi:hypothetical protein